MYERQFAKTLGKFGLYCVTNVPWFDPTQDMTKTLESAFTKAHPDQTFELNTGFTYEGILVAADAHTRAGSTAPADLMAALRATNISEHVMTGGPISFNEEGQNVQIQLVAVQNLADGPRVVLPADIASDKPVFPMPGWRDRG